MEDRSRGHRRQREDQSSSQVARIRNRVEQELHHELTAQCREGERALAHPQDHLDVDRANDRQDERVVEGHAEGRREILHDSHANGREAARTSRPE